MMFLAEWLEETIGLSPEIQGKIFISILTILILYVLRGIILRIALRHTRNLQARYRWQKISNYIVVTLIALLVGRVWIEGLRSLATFLGLLSAGVAIALKDPIMNLVGWIFIVWRRPLEIRDRIQIGEHAGDVIDIRIFQFTLLEVGNWVDADQSTGRIIHIPNGKIFTEMLANYSKGFKYIWNEVPVLITFESNWEKAKDIFQQIALKNAEHLSKSAEKRVREVARKFLIIYSKLNPTVYTSVTESGVLLTLRYLCEPRKRRDSEQAIWEDILREISKSNDIAFAYPTRRFYNNLLEGSANKKASSNPDISENMKKKEID
jgi:small-conductance mechanosensitive channel